MRASKDPFKGTPLWRPSDAERVALRGHLLAELPPGHVLFTYRETLVVEARDRNGDRLAVTCREPSAALVRMSWTGRLPMAPFLPETEVFASLEALMEAIGKVEAQ
ncbi:hypothetical protein [Jannaschia formosa]|uniref:hypothetical protein n=1 Tax=Jannaschia formosa TaxID=2259592 RepID=UPI000E1B78BB|nr:hypothetical protein [Jannaschia formosa]TFL18321.1 hypothetical protein DR046_09490 [Jannaschia formosa]